MKKISWKKEKAGMELSHILPQSEVIEAGYLESMLDNFASSYKLYWFKGIFAEILLGNRMLKYKNIVARMIASAWYPVVFYNLSLGYSDKLADAIWYIHDNLHVDREEKEEKIYDFICHSDDKILLKKIKDFTNMVPYRLIRPFYQRELEYEKKVDMQYGDWKANAIIERYNRQDHNNAFYILDRMNEQLTVSNHWYDYIRTNAAVIEGWMNYKMIRYIQERNPNVPAIPFKLFPPTPKDRNLVEATKFWKTIQMEMPLYDLYTQQELTEEAYMQYGGLSIDHFIPWSFVLHNEIWNLYPMFKNMNSEKNNKLPDKDRYLDKFCSYQYQAFLVAKNKSKLKRTMEQYLTVKKDIFSIGQSDRGRDAFESAMRQTIEPLYQIANNQGYGIWWYQ